MIISKTPYRVDLVGDGTDIESFCNKERGCIINAAIKKYIYVIVHPSRDKKIRITCGDKTEIAENIDDIKDGRVRESLRKVGILNGIEIHSIANAQTGTGLGGSGSFTIGLLKALYQYKGESTNNERIAKEACEIEIEILGEPVGRQDPYATAIGGFNRMDFIEKGVSVSKFLEDENLEKEIEKKMMMFYIGGDRFTSSILSEQSEKMQTDQKVFDSMREMRDLADEISFEAKNRKIENFGKVLQKNWDIKKGLVSGINNPKIEKYYNLVLGIGAEGAKLSGAGGTGFLLVYAPLEKQEQIRKALQDLEEHKFEFEKEGSKIIYEEISNTTQLSLKNRENKIGDMKYLGDFGIAFDLEGTLVDLEAFHHSAHLKVFEQAGLKIELDRAIKEIEHFIGGPDEAIMEYVHKLGFNNISVEEMLKLDKELYKRQLDGLKIIPPREGVLDLLNELKEKNIPYAIGSLTDANTAMMILKKSGLFDYFPKERIVLKEYVKNLKPAPDVYLETARRMNISSRNQIVFEDSYNGIRAARAAGSIAIGMPIYFEYPTAVERLKDAGVYKIFPEWNRVDLKKIIDWINFKVHRGNC